MRHRDADAVRHPRYAIHVPHYQLLLVPKFCALFVFIAAAGASFAPLTLAQRKVAVHRVASPALIVLWVFGMGAAEAMSLKVSELWLVASLIFSALSQGVLVWSVLNEGRRSASTLAFVAAPLFVSLCLMIAKPTWARLVQ